MVNSRYPLLIHMPTDQMPVELVPRKILASQSKINLNKIVLKFLILTLMKFRDTIIGPRSRSNISPGGSVIVAGKKVSLYLYFVFCFID